MEILMQPRTSRSRISSRWLAGVVAAGTLAVAPAAMASDSGGPSVTTTAAHIAKSSPFTIGLNATTAQPGSKLTVSGLANARAGTNLTITSDAIMSSRTLDDIPAVQTPALVEGIYHTTVRVPPATAPGIYPVRLRLGSGRVASTSLRVVWPGSRHGRSTKLAACSGIGFTVLHNDRTGGAYLPAGGYTVSSVNIDCGTASAEFTSFLAGAGKPIAGWTTTSTGAGRAAFTQRNSGLSFSVTRMR
jgi:hypothetical protein